MLGLKPAQKRELDEFINSFEDSELGQNYFSSVEFIRKTFLEFLKRGTIYQQKWIKKLSDLSATYLMAHFIVFHIFTY
jgi:hypothetical protein